MKLSTPSWLFYYLQKIYGIFKINNIKSMAPKNIKSSAVMFNSQTKICTKISKYLCKINSIKSMAPKKIKSSAVMFNSQTKICTKIWKYLLYRVHFIFCFSSFLATKLPKSAVIFRQRQYSWFFCFLSFKKHENLSVVLTKTNNIG